MAGISLTALVAMTGITLILFGIYSGLVEATGRSTQASSDNNPIIRNGIWIVAGAGLLFASRFV